MYIVQASSLKELVKKALTSRPVPPNLPLHEVGKKLSQHTYETSICRFIGRGFFCVFAVEDKWSSTWLKWMIVSSRHGYIFMDFEVSDDEKVYIDDSYKDSTSRETNLKCGYIELYMPHNGGNVYLYPNRPSLFYDSENNVVSFR